MSVGVFGRLPPPYLGGYEILPPRRVFYKCTSVYKPIESRVSCITSVYISVYKRRKEVRR